MNKHQQRKAQPMFTGVIKYFTKALLYVSEVSLAGNKQHHENKPLHWDMAKSTDEPDALQRHLNDAGKVDDDGKLHSGKVAWRGNALLERELLYRSENNIPLTEDIDIQVAMDWYNSVERKELKAEKEQHKFGSLDYKKEKASILFNDRLDKLAELIN